MRSSDIDLSSIADAGVIDGDEQLLLIENSTIKKVSVGSLMTDRAIASYAKDLSGNPSIFDDAIGDGVSLRIQGPGVSANVTESTVDYLTTADLSDYIYTNVQLSHRWKLGSVLRPHIHYPQIIATIPNWLIQYRWQLLGGVKATAWTSLKCTAPAFTYTAGALNQIVHTVAGITPPVGAGISDVVQFRIIRDNANGSGVFAGADPVNAVVSLSSFDVHMEFDSLGSRQEYVK